MKGTRFRHYTTRFRHYMTRFRHYIIHIRPHEHISFLNSIIDSFIDHPIRSAPIHSPFSSSIHSLVLLLHSFPQLLPLFISSITSSSHRFTSTASPFISTAHSFVARRRCRMRRLLAAPPGVNAAPVAASFGDNAAPLVASFAARTDIAASGGKSP